MKPAARLVSLATAAALGTAPAAGQGRVVLQFGGATSLPGADAVGDAALYGVGGVATDWTGDRTSLVASVYGGLAADETTGADFATAAVDAEVWWGPGSAVGLTGRAAGFRIRDPFTYRTASARGGPAARLRLGRFTAVLRPEVGVGSTLVEVRRTDDRVRRAERDLWSRGLDLEVDARGRQWRLGTAFGAWESSGGPFRRAQATATWAGRRWAVRVDTGVWDTPIGAEWTGGLSLVLPVGGSTTVAATGGRAAPDPLTLVEAGDQAGLLVGWALASFGGPPPPLTTVERSGGDTTVRFRLDLPGGRDATAVELLGDFTAWAPTPMRRDGDVWIAAVPVEPGVHHYGFRVDGEWYVPEGLSGNVPDEWGRMNATLVVDDDEGGLR